jgi:tRNA-splicing ligase RtcB
MSDITIKKIGDYKWEIPKGAVPGMRVPGIIYADDRLMKDIARDRSARQVANGATLPGIVGASMAMPDMHFGYGLPIGGVVATDIDQDGIISPGGTGYDINCGVRMAVTRLTRKDLDRRDRLQKLVDTLFAGEGPDPGSKVGR